MKDIKRIIEKWELLEVSAVPIPPNPHCIILNQWGKYKFWGLKFLLWLKGE